MVFDVNVFGLIRMTKAVLLDMRARRSGRVINMSSVGGFAPQPSWPAMSRPSTRFAPRPDPADVPAPRSTAATAAGSLARLQAIERGEAA